MLKAYVKINVSVQMEEMGEASLDPKALEALKYPLALHLHGVKNVADKETTERLVEALGRSITNALQSLSVYPEIVTEPHVPDLAAAFGGDPEPKP